MPYDKAIKYGKISFNEAKAEAEMPDGLSIFIVRM